MMDLRRVLLLVWVLLLPVVAKAATAHRAPDKPGAGALALKADGTSDFVFLHTIPCLLSESAHCFHGFVFPGPLERQHPKVVLVDGSSVDCAPDGTLTGDFV